ncbi:ABC transporter ATP-binding protein [Fusibacter ferrireducens]|uniref:ABC transporter ATP-binding protein n=1 Tax=Fusibacter ferrireducens TaxID=2785058 RepID=A0ABR9ZRB6_9FIRM|nr:ABC transporter ATP-binding protein [Fusibacter ferrireducens]MBF4692990.1 ABC transporter ATP-binding protein [Fusibacter ferrireducens]
MDAVIKMTNLRMRYNDKADYVLKGIDLEIMPGQIIGYIGPNGAGKSTTVKIMLGMIQNYEGDVEIFGENIKTNAVMYKQRIGYVPEVAVIYDSLSGYEYLIFIGELYKLDLKLVEYKAKEMFKLFGIQEALYNRISSYSKGMKQKLLIISSLIHDPDILFFDEPISGLDANSVMVFKEMIKQLSEQGKTIFYSSHIMEVVEKISDRIILLNKGVIAADGDFEMLKEKSKEGSLQDIFNQLTGFNEHEIIAKSLVETIRLNSIGEHDSADTMIQQEV